MKDARAFILLASRGVEELRVLEWLILTDSTKESTYVCTVFITEPQRFD